MLAEVIAEKAAIETMRTQMMIMGQSNTNTIVKAIPLNPQTQPVLNSQANSSTRRRNRRKKNNSSSTKISQPSLSTPHTLTHNSKYTSPSMDTVIASHKKDYTQWLSKPVDSKSHPNANCVEQAVVLC